MTITAKADGLRLKRADYASRTLLWARSGFDGIDELQLHVGIDAHRNENQHKTATQRVSEKRNNVLAFPVKRHAAELQMAA